VFVIAAVVLLLSVVAGVIKVDISIVVAVGDAVVIIVKTTFFDKTIVVGTIIATATKTAVTIEIIIHTNFLLRVQIAYLEKIVFMMSCQRVEYTYNDVDGTTVTPLVSTVNE
jgi:hypothetical protein